MIDHLIQAAVFGVAILEVVALWQDRSRRLIIGSAIVTVIFAGAYLLYSMYADSEVAKTHAEQVAKAKSSMLSLVCETDRSFDDMMEKLTPASYSSVDYEPINEAFHDLVDVERKIRINVIDPPSPFTPGATIHLRWLTPIDKSSICRK